MTEQELCLTLGLLDEPEHNRLNHSTHLAQDIRVLREAFAMAKQQHNLLGFDHLELWLEFLPWHSLN